MSNLFTDPRIVGLLAFIGGLLVARTSAFLQSKANETEATASDRRVRSLEADLRVANKNLEKANEKLQKSDDELESVNGVLVDVQAALEERTKELEESKALLKNECGKTDSLRVNLSGRAEETIRAEVHAREVEVELSVLKAGSSAVHEEVDRLAAERQELTGRLQQLEEEFLRVEEMDEDRPKDNPDLDEPLIDF